MKKAASENLIYKEYGQKAWEFCMDSTKKREWLTRLEKGPAKDAVKYHLAPSTHWDAENTFEYLNQVNMAHTVMLFEQGIISRHEASEILKALKELEVGGLDLLKPLNERVGFYFNVEGFVIKRTSEAVGGKMHIGRSRNDLSRTLHRLFVRDKINVVVSELIRLRKALIKLAEENLDAVMPGYTHTQQAQPITLAHWAMSYADPIGRKIACLEDAYRLTNLNPLGAAALAGTGFPINRNRTTKLLGFADLIENSLDAVSTIDFAVYALSALSIAASDISRLCEDLILFHSWEFKLIELADEYCGSSSIMPQKKNPSPLEFCRGGVGSVYGDFAAAISSGHGLISGLSMDLWASVRRFSNAVQKMKGIIRTVTGVVSTLKANKEVMMDKLTLGFSQATELADTIVRKKRLSFRTAHKVVGLVVLNAVRNGFRTTNVTSEMVDEAAKVVIGKPLELEDEEVRLAMDPLENVRRRKSRGGPAPEEVKRMLEERKKKVGEEEDRLHNRLDVLEAIREELKVAVDSIIE